MTGNLLNSACFNSFGTRLDGESYESWIPAIKSAGLNCVTAGIDFAYFQGAEWGIFGANPRVRYPDETYDAYFNDMAQAMAGEGWGWCYDDGLSAFSPFCCAPSWMTPPIPKSRTTPSTSTRRC